jgi:hypothetical protein
MRLYVDHGGIEQVIECVYWTVIDGIVHVYDKANWEDFDPIASFKEWSYVGEQPFDDLLAFDPDEGIVPPPPPPPATSNPNVDIERND